MQMTRFGRESDLRQRITMRLLGLETCDSRWVSWRQKSADSAGVDRSTAYLGFGSVAETPKRNNVWKAKKMK